MWQLRRDPAVHTCAHTGKYAEGGGDMYDEIGYIVVMHTDTHTHYRAHANIPG